MHGIVICNCVTVSHSISSMLEVHVPQDAEMALSSASTGL